MHTYGFLDRCEHTGGDGGGGVGTVIYGPHKLFRSDGIDLARRTGFSRLPPSVHCTDRSPIVYENVLRFKANISTVRLLCSKTGVIDDGLGATRCFRKRFSTQHEYTLHESGERLTEIKKKKNKKKRYENNNNIVLVTIREYV